MPACHRQAAPLRKGLHGACPICACLQSAHSHVVNGDAECCIAQSLNTSPTQHTAAQRAYRSPGHYA